MLSCLRNAKARRNFPAAQLALFQKASLSTLAPTIRQMLAQPPPPDCDITARGHIRAIRPFKNIGFIDISDGSISNSLNVVFSDPESVLRDSNFKVGQSIEITGKWAISKAAQSYELQYDSSNPAHSISVLGEVPENYPIQKKSSTMQFLRSLPTLRHRTSTLASVLRFRSRVESIVGEFFQQNDFVKVAPPIITASDCEGAGEQFAVQPLQQTDPATKFFGKDAYLSVSSQLYLEVLSLSLNRVWTLAPCFRAEHSNTNRHLSEFWMLEVELNYVDQVSSLTNLVEEMIRYVAEKMKNDTADLKAGSYQDLVNSRFQKEEAAKIEDRWTSLLGAQPWASITYTEAIEILNKIKSKGRSKGRLSWGDSISTEDEKWLAGTHYKSPVFITDYPKSQKPFYMLPSSPADTETGRDTVACFDLLFPEIGEVVGGSLREHDASRLEAEMVRRGMQLDPMEWYLSTRKNGSVSHGGFGLGFERLIAYLAGIDNIRDVSAFPRAPEVCPC